jgi:copper chaperone NosL
MIVSERRFAAAVVPDDGRGDPLAFDDVGCLFAWEKRNPEAPVRARWVGDHGGRGWLRAEEAWYVRSPDLRSPMGSGVAAVADESAARELVGERRGRAMSWTGLREEEATGGLLRPPDPAGATSATERERSEG